MAILGLSYAPAHGHRPCGGARAEWLAVPGHAAAVRQLILMTLCGLSPQECSRWSLESEASAPLYRDVATMSRPDRRGFGACSRGPLDARCNLLGDAAAVPSNVLPGDGNGRS